MIKVGGFAQLRLLHQHASYLTQLDLATVIHALVTAHLDSDNTLYTGLPLKMVCKLHLVLNDAACVVTEI